MDAYHASTREVEKLKREEREREYPNEELHHWDGNGARPTVHVFGSDGYWQVWLNPDGTPDTGTCLGVGETRQEAVADAVQQLEWATRTLQETPAPPQAQEEK